jgi:hypothetical protein
MVQKISKERLERSLAEGENLSKLTNTTKNWLRQNIVKDNDVKATNKTQEAADKLINTKSKGLINWVKDNPIETALLFTGVGGLTRGAVKYIGKKYGPKAVKKAKTLLIEYKKKSSPTGNINKAKPPSTIFQGSNIKKKTATASQKEAQAKIMKKINESKTFKKLTNDDKKKVVSEFAKVNKGKPITSIISQVIKKNGKKTSVINKPTGTKPKVVKTDKPKVNKTTTKTKTDKTYNVIDPKTGRITGAAKKAENKRRMEIIKKQRAESKKRKEDKEKADKPKVVKTETKPKVNKTPTKTVATTKNTNFIINDTLSKSFKQNPTKVRDQIMNSNMGRAEKNSLLSTLQGVNDFQKRNKGASFNYALSKVTGKKQKFFKRGGLIKKNIGGTVLKDIPAGNKGLPNLPTNVRNDMGYKKKGGVIKRNKGGFLGVGKALRGQGAVMRKKGGKIAY